MIHFKRLFDIFYIVLNRRLIQSIRFCTARSILTKARNLLKTNSFF
ncbi:hypothetical protein LEP1GSC060_1810 [Leptospira weilii serovar Ranarum str. ICFT]|uniref:Uncharacterized protein n=1 Tax=Leptospira weilii serovar Ranarum str. ICFT TaxID=1218598 RepID=N1WLQ7_9LEPT|nr:hypothetical protein LEP1GSC060_1810 [Leptospira weilii serovar Ranarum str. ICFT]